MPFSSIVGAGKLLDYIYMKKSICQNMRDVSFSKLHIQLSLLIKTSFTEFQLIIYNFSTEFTTNQIKYWTIIILNIILKVYFFPKKENNTFYSRLQFECKVHLLPRNKKFIQWLKEHSPFNLPDSFID